MVFSSLLFLYAFLPLNLLFYVLARGIRMKNAVMLLFSLVFYAWGEPKYVLLLIGMTLADWVFALIMDKARSSAGRRAALIGACVVNLGLLGVFKYGTFAMENLHSLTGFPSVIPEIALPIGISFYTFQAMSYIVDLYRGDVEVQRDIVSFGTYVSLFPQLIAGPIVRMRTVAGELRCREENFDEFGAGVRRFAAGLCKKVLLANTVGQVWESISAMEAAEMPVLTAWLGLLAFTFQIYFDFSGYSDMAIGLGRMFGFHFLENFNYPYTAVSVTDFWRRWHISLSTWFRDYVYIPLGGNRVKKSRWIRNILVVWALTGFWHGAQWNFLFWGLYYGLLLLAEKLFLGRLLERLPKAVRWLYTAFFVLIGWVLFNLTDFPSLCHALKLMFVPQATDWVAAAATNVSLLKAVVYLPLGIVCCLPLLRREPKSTKGILLADLASGLLLIVCIVFILSSSYNPFIYFRF